MIEGGISFYNVFLNGTLLQVLELSLEREELLLLLPLDPSEIASLVISKRNEPKDSQNSDVLWGIEVEEGGRLLPPTKPRNRRLEVIGDSITSGYGMLSESNDGPSCHRFYHVIQNSWMTYSLLIAHQLQGGSVCDVGRLSLIILEAEVHVESLSGATVITSEGPYDTMPLWFSSTLGRQRSPDWDFQRFVPQAVIINLGTNDFRQFQKEQLDAEFEVQYRQFLSQIRSAYGHQVHFFLVCGAMVESLPGCQLIEEIAKTEANSFYIQVGDDFGPSDYGVSDSAPLSPNLIVLTVRGTSERGRAAKDCRQGSPHHSGRIGMVNQG